MVVGFFDVTAVAVIFLMGMTFFRDANKTGLPSYENPGISENAGILFSALGSSWTRCHIRSPGSRLACFTQLVNWFSSKGSCSKMCKYRTSFCFDSTGGNGRK